MTSSLRPMQSKLCTQVSDVQCVSADPCLLEAEMDLLGASGLEDDMARSIQVEVERLPSWSGVQGSLGFEAMERRREVPASLTRSLEVVRRRRRAAAARRYFFLAGEGRGTTQ